MNAVELTENHGSSSRGDDDPPFFADMTLDLAEAHDIAETPEATHRKLLHTKDQLASIPKMPVIPQNGVISTHSLLSNSNDNMNPDFNANLRSITHEQTHGRISAMGNIKPLPATRNMPRDVYWSIAFAIFVPFSLLGPIMSSKDAEAITSKTYWLGTSLALRMATVHSLWWAAIAAVILSRLLYRTLGGGDGDDARHLASQIVLLSAPVSVSIYFSLMLIIYFFLPHARFYVVLPAWALARGIYIFRQWKMTSSTPGGRQAFFQALTCMTLDILSRSLRRASFYRIVSALLLLQLMVIGLWRMALNAAMHSQSTFWLLLAAIGGKWATGTVARLLSLISSGGISNWFAEQNSLVEEMEKVKADRENESGLSSSVHSKSDDEDSEIPEAYRVTAASAYQTTLITDEGIDDDFEDEDDTAATVNAPITTFLSTPIAGGSTVKQLLLKGVTVSFGSVCKCGLLGGLAQFVWSQLRKIDTARAKLSGFQTMSIGQSNDFQNGKIRHYLMLSNRVARAFVRNNSDMAMSHVAAFQKSYNRAAQDVAILIDESGVELIIHDDISTHMAACVGGSISGAIVMFTGIILVHQKKSNITDSAVVMDMVVSFIFCYTLIFTVMEPLRAAIKAVYVSFAQHPQSISHSFPLIFHRLSRMAKSNVQ